MRRDHVAPRLIRGQKRVRMKGRGPVPRPFLPRDERSLTLGEMAPLAEIGGHWPLLTPLGRYASLSA